jgi:hypothetical protein
MVSWKQPNYSLTFLYADSGTKGTLNWDRPFVGGPDWSSAGGALLATVSANAVADAKSKALKKARDMKINVAVTLGEGRKTVNMIADTARTLGKAYTAFRRGDLKTVAKALGVKKPTKGASNHWLAWSYGWMPLVSDVVGLAEFAAQQVEETAGRKPRFSTRGKTLMSLKAPDVQGTATAPYPLGTAVKYNWRPEKDGGCLIKANAGLLLELEYTSAATAAQLGLGLTDAALFAWELIPFSFVFDWFIDVGTWLEQLSGLQGIKVLSGFSSVEESLKGEFYHSLSSNEWQLQGTFPRTFYSMRRYSRASWDGGQPTIRVHFADGLSARRIVTTAALWRQLSRGDRIPGLDKQSMYGLPPKRRSPNYNP